MKEQLQEALTQLITRSIGAAEKAGTFLEAEIPEIIQQLLIYQFVWNLLWWSLSIVAMILFTLIFKKIFREYDGEHDAQFGTIITYATFMVIPIVGFAVNFDWLKIWLAPKVYILEYAKNLF